MKIQRLLGITMILLSQRRVNAQTLADKFEVSLRTIYRDLEAINAAGIPIVSYTGNDGGYEIMQQYRIDRQLVTFDDLQSILTALKGMQSSLHDEEMDSLLTKISALVARSERMQREEDAETVLFDTNLWHGGGIKDKSILVALRDAAKSRKVVTFFYTSTDGASEQRETEPIGLAWKGYAWYLYAYCRLRNDFRTFRLSRISGFRVLLEHFTSRGVSMRELDQRWGNQETGPALTVKLRFHPRARIRVEEAFGINSMEQKEDGYVHVVTDVPDNHWLYGMLLSYGADLQVLEPAEVANRVKREAEQIALKYT